MPKTSQQLQTIFELKSKNPVAFRHVDKRVIEVQVDHTDGAKLEPKNTEGVLGRRVNKE